MRSLALPLGTVGWLATTSQASDPIGIYAIVDKVVFEPATNQAQRVQVWGSFSMASGHGDHYDDPKSGYLYYRLKPDKARACRNEWADLKSVAGTEQVVGFSSRYAKKGRIRNKNEKPKTPDLYPLGWGVVKERETDYGPIHKLIEFHRQEAEAHPSGGAASRGVVLPQNYGTDS